MDRNRKRKTATASFSEKDNEEAVKLVLQNGQSVREAALEKGLSFQLIAK
jgi:transposase-like protein